MSNPLHRMSWISVLLLLPMLTMTAAEEPLSAEERTAEKGFNADRAYRYLVQICRIGRRVSGSRGMARQQRLLAGHFAEFETQIRFQGFRATHPLSGRPVRMNNMIVSWHPESRQRVLLACHYDTRPFPDLDRRNPRGKFLGANDGASGVALFMEMAHHMESLQPTYGVDMVFFDGEELVYGERGEYFLGSTHFAENYRKNPPEHRYVYGVLVDMIADRNLNLPMEKNSLEYAPRLTRSLWRVGRKLGFEAFIPREKHEIRDDHLPLNRIAKIPTCDIIDFDYPHWHTTRDVPRNCSGESMATVGRTLLRWLENVPAPETDP